MLKSTAFLSNSATIHTIKLKRINYESYSQSKYKRNAKALVVNPIQMLREIYMSTFSQSQMIGCKKSVLYFVQTRVFYSSGLSWDSGLAKSIEIRP